MSEMSDYRWKLLKSFPGGHKFFLEVNSSRISICDESGPNPGETDDGPLWLDKSENLFLDASGFGNIMILCVVLSQRTGRKNHVMCTLAAAKYLMEEHGYKLNLDNKVLVFQ